MKFRYDRIVDVGAGGLPRLHRGPSLNRLPGWVVSVGDGRRRWFNMAIRAQQAVVRHAKAGRMANICEAVHEVRFDRRLARDVFTLYVGESAGASPRPKAIESKLSSRRWDCILST